MQHYDRVGVLGLVVGLAAYLTGLQKAVLEPILDWFRDLPPAGELAALVAVALVVAGVLVMASRRRRAELATAVAQVDANLAAEPVESR